MIKYLTRESLEEESWALAYKWCGCMVMGHGSSSRRPLITLFTVRKQRVRNAYVYALFIFVPFFCVGSHWGWTFPPQLTFPIQPLTDMLRDFFTWWFQVPWSWQPWLAIIEGNGMSSPVWSRQLGCKMSHSFSKEISETTNRRERCESGQEILVDRRLNKGKQEIKLRGCWKVWRLAKKKHFSQTLSNCVCIFPDKDHWLFSSL